MPGARAFCFAHELQSVFPEVLHGRGFLFTKAFGEHTTIKDFYVQPSWSLGDTIPVSIALSMLLSMSFSMLAE